ncbi:hypothetical protein HYP85_gp030 [Pseudomonas phage Zuri]|uniref:Uncharacterized protein n=1 Tax=Pseudomonas phage Zuri TaxID=2604899 RepID=A0A5C1K6Y5_9CAUD|nr:hypothetical protein HYP85_gp030 [Pseudomonas phage Zuri]QEM41127.1 hypothetical protein Zuri_30 [Pseudomonas phage Zuri]
MPTILPVIRGGDMNRYPPVSQQVKDRLVAYNQKHPSWGSLHIIMADYNVNESDVLFCLNSAHERQDREGYWLALELLKMSRTQRNKLAHIL